jgi:hypothetical protein
MNSGNSSPLLTKNIRERKLITSEAGATRHWTFVKVKPRTRPRLFNGTTMETKTKFGSLLQYGDDVNSLILNHKFLDISNRLMPVEKGSFWLNPV